MLKLKYTIAALLCSLFLLTSCADENMGRVTLHIQRNDLAWKFKKEHPVLAAIDEIFKVFSKEAFAGTDWVGTQGPLTVTVESDNYTTLTYAIPTGATTYSILVPAGVNTTITVVSYLADDGLGRSYNNWGSKKTIDIAGGKETSLTLTMIPTTFIRNVSVSTGLTLVWQIVGSGTYTQGQGFKVYKSTNPIGPFTLIETIANIDAGTNTEDTNVNPGTVYYYYVTVYGTDGEGVGSIVKSGSLPPLE